MASSSFIDWTKIVDALISIGEVLIEKDIYSPHIDKREITHIGDKYYLFGIPIPNLGHNATREYEDLLLEKWANHFPNVSVPILTLEDYKKNNVVWIFIIRI